MTITNPNIFAGERKKYLDTVLNTLEKSIRYERFKNPYLNREDSQKFVNEMDLICRKTAEDNKIPFSAFEEIFKNSEIGGALFFLLKSGDQKNSQQPEEIPKNKRKRNLGW